MCELALGECVQKVGLVLGEVMRLQQVVGSRLVATGTDVMAGGEVIGAKFERLVQEKAELHVAVAAHAGVRRLPRLVLGAEIVHDEAPELLFQMHLVELYPEVLGDHLGVPLCLRILPVAPKQLHVYADHLSTLLFQEGGDRR